MRRPTLTVLVVLVGLVLIADLLVVNTAATLAGIVIDAAILVAAGAALAGVGSLAARRARPLASPRRPARSWARPRRHGRHARRGSPPRLDGDRRSRGRLAVAALLVPIGASLFGLLFISTLSAARRSLQSRGREGTLLVGSAVV